jgi:hypothetical protein
MTSYRKQLKKAQTCKYPKIAGAKTIANSSCVMRFFLCWSEMWRNKVKTICMSLREVSSIPWRNNFHCSGIFSGRVSPKLPYKERKKRKKATTYFVKKSISCTLLQGSSHLVCFQCNSQTRQTLREDWRYIRAWGRILLSLTKVSGALG